MMDRFARSEIDLGIEERTGCKFIVCAQQLYFKFNQPRSICAKKDNEMKSLFAAIDDLIRSYNQYESDREKFVTPENIREDYVTACRNYESLRRNPESFYKSEEYARQALLREQARIDEKIKAHEVEIARAEDAMNLELSNLRSGLTQELASLQKKKKKYELQNTETNKKYFPLYYRNYTEKLPAIVARIAVVEGELKATDKKRSSDVEELDGKIKRMYTRRWEIDKELLVLEDKPKSRMIRWEGAKDKAQIEANMLRMDIEDAVSRHYSSYSQQAMHAFLNVYAWVRICAKKSSPNSDEVKTSLSSLAELADLIYCPEIANRSVLTLYQKLSGMADSDREMVIAKKPNRNHLPEELLRTFSVSRLHDSTDLMKMFKDIFPVNPLASSPSAVPSAFREVAGLKK